MSNALREERIESPVTVELIRKSDFQKEDSLTAQLRQAIKVIGYYPSKQSTNSMTESLFKNSDFGYEEQPFESIENRVAFLLVPETATMEEIAARLLANPQSRIYRVLSNYPILTTSQRYAITQGLKTMEEFANSQVARFGEGTVNKAGVDVSGKLVTKDGKPQYRCTFFSVNGKPDIDLRNSDPSDFYSTDEIDTELESGLNRTETREVELHEITSLGEQTV